MATEEVDITSTDVPSTGFDNITRDISKQFILRFIPGCQVESVNITADAGQEMENEQLILTRKIPLLHQTIMMTANNKTDLQDWVNFWFSTGRSRNISEEQLTTIFLLRWHY